MTSNGILIVFKIQSIEIMTKHKKMFNYKINYKM